MNGAEDTPWTSGDRPSCEELCRTYQARVLQLCRLLLADRHEAEEVAQEVFLKLVRERKKQTRIQSWEAWLTRVTVNACHDHRRSAWWKWRHGATFTLQDDEFPSGDLTPEEQLLTREEREQVWHTFHALSARQREVFVLRRLEGWSTEEVAVLLGLTTGSVKRHLFHALRHLHNARRGQS
jgi:RNA polymerase sigma-70 factor (ECF subfamily)